MTGRAFAQCWIDCAQLEVERRRQTYPRLIADGKLDAELASVDFQAWQVILEWLESGRCSMIGGWAGELDQTVMSWALCEERALRGLEAIEARIAREIAAPTPNDAKLEALRKRREGVWCIHHVMVQQRELADKTAAMVAATVAEIRSAKAAAETPQGQAAYSPGPKNLAKADS